MSSDKGCYVPAIPAILPDDRPGPETDDCVEASPPTPRLGASDVVGLSAASGCSAGGDVDELAAGEIEAGIEAS